MKESGLEHVRIKAVVDTNVFVAAVFWRGSARECLLRFARREFDVAASEQILEEYAETAWELKLEEGLSQNPQPWLNWIGNRAILVAPLALNKPASSDPDDDKFIECALAAQAGYIISRDKHLLRLEKPFGIDVLDDRQFLAMLQNR